MSVSMNSDVWVRARRASRRMAFASRAIMVMMVAGCAIALGWFAIDQAPFETLARARFGPTTSLGEPTQIAAIAILVAIQIGLMVVALAKLGAAFDHLGQSEPLNAAAARFMRSSGVWLALATAAGIVLQVPLTYAITLANGPGERAISVSLSGGHVIALFAAAALISFAHICALAADVRADQSQIV